MELRGEALKSALESTRDPLIQVRDDRRELGRVSRYVALAMIESGDYFGVGNPKRVRHLRQIPIAPAISERDDSFWAGRATLRFWAEPTESNCSHGDPTCSKLSAHRMKSPMSADDVYKVRLGLGRTAIPRCVPWYAPNSAELDRWENEGGQV